MSRPKTDFSLEEKVRRFRDGAYGGHFGGCPVCGDSYGPFNVLAMNWFVCREHRICWCGGNIVDSMDYEYDHRPLIERYLDQFREIPASECFCVDEPDPNPPRAKWLSPKMES